MLAERTQRGPRARAHAGKPIIGPKPPYGLHWDEAAGRFQPYEPEVAVLRRIVRELLDGSSLRRVRDGLRQDGILTPTGRAMWQCSTISHLLRDERYTGKGAAYRYKTERCNGGSHRVVVPEGWSVPLPDGVFPQIITPDECAVIRAILERNRVQAVRNNREPEKFLLRAGFIRCGLCGNVMAATNAGGRYRYRCATRDKVFPPCPKPLSKARRSKPQYGRASRRY
jgi:site-specific DNA recombinase